MGLGWEEFTMDKLEFYGRVNMMKGGIVYADAVSTVSEKYMEEIQTAEYGEKLDGLLHSMKQKLYGITNGIDVDVWNPASDKQLEKTFSGKNAEGKQACKSALQKECGFPQTKTPLFSMVTRLADQKGLDILAPVMEDFLKNDVQFAVLGTGSKNYEELFQKLSEKYPQKVKSFLEFNDALSHRIYAGSDFFVMPSRFEPCGLGQMIAMRYGTLPLVRSTGGLADSVDDGIDGFEFEKYSGIVLAAKMSEAVKLWCKNGKSWQKMMSRAMEKDFSWTKSAKIYLKLYKDLLAQKYSRSWK